MTSPKTADNQLNHFCKNFKKFSEFFQKNFEFQAKMITDRVRISPKTSEFDAGLVSRVSQLVCHVCHRLVWPLVPLYTIEYL